MSSIGNAVQNYAQDPAKLTQGERDANVKDLTRRHLQRIKMQEKKLQWRRNGSKQSQRKRTSRA